MRLLRKGTDRSLIAGSCTTSATSAVAISWQAARAVSGVPSWQVRADPQSSPTDVG